ncbi:hypothetical protein [Streptomyces sp. MAR4 CNX-425]|uniref:hypothetical protein n=1 Tax=Streptomyces sp. MAR4 CNX-425 TaxID=3406343 RepID=UPI003B50742F
MNELIALVQRLASAPQLTGELLAAALEEEGWSVPRARPGAPFQRVWQKDGLTAGIQGDPPGIHLAVTLWLREVDEDDEGFEALEALYEEAEAESRRLAAEVEQGPLGGRLAPAEGDQTGGLDYLHHSAWRLGDRTLLIGAIQQDSDLPVLVEAIVG